MRESELDWDRARGVLEERPLDLFSLFFRFLSIIAITRRFSSSRAATCPILTCRIQLERAISYHLLWFWAGDDLPVGSFCQKLFLLGARDGRFSATLMSRRHDDGCPQRMGYHDQCEGIRVNRSPLNFCGNLTPNPFPRGKGNNRLEGSDSCVFISSKRTGCRSLLQLDSGYAVEEGVELLCEKIAEEEFCECDHWGAYDDAA